MPLQDFLADFDRQCLHIDAPSRRGPDHSVILKADPVMRIPNQLIPQRSFLVFKPFDR
jgi:hypothetical protein